MWEKANGVNILSVLKIKENNGISACITYNNNQRPNNMSISTTFITKTNTNGHVIKAQMS